MAAQPGNLPPGFMVVHGNHPESLRDLMLGWMSMHPLAPLDDEVVLVQSNGVAQWLKLSMAADPQDGGAGIAAALRTQLPSQAVWDAYRAVLGRSAVPEQSPFDKAPLVWRLMRLLPSLLENDAFAPLRRFLEHDPDGRKLHQLAMRVADLLDQYQVYRGDWLADWAEGRDVAKGVGARNGLAASTAATDLQLGRDKTRAPRDRATDAIPSDLRWQPELWRALLADVGAAGAANSRGEVHARFLAACQRGDLKHPDKLPRRITVFGVSSLPQQTLEVLAALAQWTQVLLCVHNPCEHDWSHIVADQHLLRATRLRQKRRAGQTGEQDAASLHLQAHPLLAAWGRQGRDFIRLLDAHDERESYEPRFAAVGMRIDNFEHNPADSLLRQLQDDIRELRPLAETRALWPAVDADKDRSIEFHIAHGPQREVEVLHDQLLRAFANDKTLRPRDVIVMVPDVATYAPHIQAVFGLFERPDARHIPFNVADQAQRAHDPLLGALEQLLNLPQSRLAMSDVLDLLEVPALRRRFGIAENDLPLLHRWIAAARIRWGLHAEHREQLALPAAIAQNTWDFGLRRMLLGYAVGAGDVWEDIAPLDEIGGLDAALLGPLVRLIETLEDCWRGLSRPATPADWSDRLAALLDDFFEAEEGSIDGLTLMRLRSTLHEWALACQGARLTAPLPLTVVREHWLSRIEPSGLNQPFFAGGMTFASLMPMRAIPFKWVALLGMNDGDYPRSRVPMDFDLMANDYRPGDRSRREDDRYLFLEALLSAREHLHVSWVGRSITDNSERPPSVLVAQLRDHLAAGWRAERAVHPDLAASISPVAPPPQPSPRAGGSKAGQHLAQPEEESQTDLPLPPPGGGWEGGDPATNGKTLLQQLTIEHRLQPFHADYFNGSSPHHFSYAREWRASLAPQAEEDLTPYAPLPPLPREAALTVRLLADFAKDPVRSFFRERLGIDFREGDPAGDDQEPFALDALVNWQLQDELIQAQQAAVDAGQSREDALEAGLARMAMRGDLPLGAFAERVRDSLAKPMADLFSAYERHRMEWPHVSADEVLDLELRGTDPPLKLDDWLPALRRNAAGERGRVVLESSSLVASRAWRFERLLPHWVTHLLGQLGGDALTTIVISKAGNATLRPLDSEQVEAHVEALLRAWQEGQCRALPFAVQSAVAWLKAAPSDPDDQAAAALAEQAARSAYDRDEPEFGQVGERARNPYLARAFPNFDALWNDGEFVHWAEALLQPLMDAVGTSPPKADA